MRSVLRSAFRAIALRREERWAAAFSLALERKFEARGYPRYDYHAYPSGPNCIAFLRPGEKLGGLLVLYARAHRTPDGWVCINIERLKDGTTSSGEAVENGVFREASVAEMAYWIGEVGDKLAEQYRVSLEQAFAVRGVAISISEYSHRGSAGYPKYYDELEHFVDCEVEVADSGWISTLRQQELPEQYALRVSHEFGRLANHTLLGPIQGSGWKPIALRTRTQGSPEDVAEWVCRTISFQQALTMRGLKLAEIDFKRTSYSFEPSSVDAYWVDVADAGWLVLLGYLELPTRYELSVWTVFGGGRRARLRERERYRDIGRGPVPWTDLDYDSPEEVAEWLRQTIEHQPSSLDREG